MDELEKIVYKQDWEKVRRGSSPISYGFSLHEKKGDCGVFINQYVNKIPADVPDAFLRPIGKSYKVFVSDDLYQKVMENISNSGLQFDIKDAYDLKDKVYKINRR